MAHFPDERVESFIGQLRKLITDFEQNREGQEGDKPEPLSGDADLLKFAEALYATRRRREAYFSNQSLFGEPAWDLLLDLFIAQSRSKRVSVSGACIAASVPATTGLRWISVLENEGLVERHHDPADARRAWLKLTLRGARSVRNFLQSAEEKWEQIVR